MSALSWALGFCVGAGAVAVNLWAMQVMVRSILRPGVRAPRLLSALGFAGRLLMVGVLVGLGMRYLPIHPVGVVVGVSLAPVVLLIRTLGSQLFAASRVK